MELDYILPPPVAFYFNVHFVAIPSVRDMAFMEVSGLLVELSVEEVAEGGGLKRRLPGGPKHSNLICKRPMKPLSLSDLSMWTEQTMYGGVHSPIITSPVIVTLLGSLGEPQCGWMITGAYPVKWEVAPFDSKKNNVVVETIEFAFDTITRVL